MNPCVMRILFPFQFEGANGDQLIEVGATFTKHQKFTIEELKERRRRDGRLNAFLTEQERRPECRRQELQGILAVEHMRLVKYPLLLEQLAKQSAPPPSTEDGAAAAAADTADTAAAADGNEDEIESVVVKRCVDRSREILECIDRQVAEAQNEQKLSEIQKYLDTSGLEKMPDSTICAEYRVSEHTSYVLRNR